MVGTMKRRVSGCIRHCGNYMNNHSQIFFVGIEFPFEFDSEIFDIVGGGRFFKTSSYHVYPFRRGERGEEKGAGCSTPIEQPWREFEWQKKRVLI
jgi:hypothetical protein